jgi:ribosomal-protein-alanine N-acetyltransferase
MADEPGLPPVMPPTPVLETPRLILRPIRADDLDAMRRRFDQWEVVKYLSDSVPWPLPPDNFEIAMADTLEKMARRERCSWAITLKEDPDELIGRIDLWADDGVSRDQRGFWLDPAFWGQGLTTEAAERVTEFAFLELGWPQLWLCNAELNVASHRVKEKQGATIVARSPRAYVYGEGVRVTWLLTREAWLERWGR